MITFGEFCAGAGGVSAGLRGLVQPMLAVEIDPAIAEVHAANHPGMHLLVEDVTAPDLMRRYGDRPDWQHWSPSCKHASQANTNGGETAADIAVAEAICRHIEQLTPRWFSLENVRGYQRFPNCWPRIVETLRANGYHLWYGVLCAADYGIPQTRDRLWLLASRENRVYKPTPTHNRTPQPLDWRGAMTHRWLGWHGAIEHLIDDLPESAFAPWQMEKLQHLPGLMSYLVDCTHRTGGDLTARPGDEPAHTIAASHARRPGNLPRAFLVHPTDQRTMPVRAGDDPSFTIMAGSHTAQRGPSWRPRAFLVSGGSDGHLDLVPTRDAGDPVMTITTGANRMRAFVVDDQHNGGRGGLTIREAAEPVFTISATQTKRSLRALLDNGRTVALTPRAGAALQTFPADFILPDRPQLAWLGVGNAVPPAWMPHIKAALGVPGGCHG